MMDISRYKGLITNERWLEDLSREWARQTGREYEIVSKVYVQMPTNKGKGEKITKIALFELGKEN